MTIELIVIQIFNCVVVRMIYVLIAMGLSIVWRMMDIINFCHGLFYTLAPIWPTRSCPPREIFSRY